MQGLGILESHPALKSKAVKEGAFKLLSALAYRFQQLDVVTGAAVDLLNKHEHVPVVLAELSEFALARHGDARLVSTLHSKQANPLAASIPGLQSMQLPPEQGSWNMRDIHQGSVSSCKTTTQRSPVFKAEFSFIKAMLLVKFGCGQGCLSCRVSSC